MTETGMEYESPATAFFITLRPHFPDSLPVAFHFDDVLEQTLPAYSIWIDLKTVAIASVQVGINDDSEYIVTVQGLSLP